MRLSGEIMEVAFATTGLDLLLAALFPASGPDNKNKNGKQRRGTMADYRAFVAFFLAQQWVDLLDVNVSMDAKLQVII